jgi:hypothetical protein
VVLRTNDAVESRAIACTFYYLGIVDGMCASLETFKGLNPEPLKDAAWQTTLRSYLPPELAALRHPDANRAAAVTVIVEEFKEFLARRKRQTRKKRNL